MVKIVQVQFLDIAWFLSRSRIKIQRQNEINKKLRNRIAASFFAPCLFYFTVHRSRENLRNLSTLLTLQF